MRSVRVVSPKVADCTSASGAVKPPANKFRATFFRHGIDLRNLRENSRLSCHWRREKIFPMRSFVAWKKCLIDKALLRAGVKRSEIIEIFRKKTSSVNARTNLCYCFSRRNRAKSRHVSPDQLVKRADEYAALAADFKTRLPVNGHGRRIRRVNG